MNEVKREIGDLSRAIEDQVPFNLVRELLEKYHDPEYAREHEHYWIRSNGDFGSAKPLSLGPRGHFSNLNAWNVQNFSMTPDINYEFWPSGGMARVASKEVAIRIVRALMARNMIARLQILSIEAR